MAMVSDTEFVQLVDDPQILARLLADYTLKLKNLCDKIDAYKLYAQVISIAVVLGALLSYGMAFWLFSPVNSMPAPRGLHLYHMGYGVAIVVLTLFCLNLFVEAFVLRRRRVSHGMETGITQLARMIRICSQYHEHGRFKDRVTRWDVAFKLADAEAVLHDAERLFGKREDQLRLPEYIKPAIAEPAPPSYQQVSNL